MNTGIEPLTGNKNAAQTLVILLFSLI